MGKRELGLVFSWCGELRAKQEFCRTQQSLQEAIKQPTVLSASNKYNTLQNAESQTQVLRKPIGHTRGKKEFYCFLGMHQYPLIQRHQQSWIEESSWEVPLAVNKGREQEIKQILAAQLCPFCRNCICRLKDLGRCAGTPVWRTLAEQSGMKTGKDFVPQCFVNKYKCINNSTLFQHLLLKNSSVPHAAE